LSLDSAAPVPSRRRFAGPPGRRRRTIAAVSNDVPCRGRLASGSAISAEPPARSTAKASSGQAGSSLAVQNALAPSLPREPSGASAWVVQRMILSETPAPARDHAYSCQPISAAKSMTRQACWLQLEIAQFSHGCCLIECRILSRSVPDSGFANKIWQRNCASARQSQQSGSSTMACRSCEKPTRNALRRRKSLQPLVTSLRISSSESKHDFFDRLPPGIIDPEVALGMISTVGRRNRFMSALLAWAHECPLS